MGPRNRVLHGGPDPLVERGNFGERAPIVNYRHFLPRDAMLARY